MNIETFRVGDIFTITLRELPARTPAHAQQLQLGWSVRTPVRVRTTRETRIQSCHVRTITVVVRRLFLWIFSWFSCSRHLHLNRYVIDLDVRSLSSVTATRSAISSKLQVDVSTSAAPYVSQVHVKREKEIEINGGICLYPGPGLTGDAYVTKEIICLRCKKKNL